MRATLLCACCALGSAISANDPVPGDVPYQKADEPYLTPHTAKEWKIWAYSRAAPKYLADDATVMEGTTVLRNGSNGWTCMAANPRGPRDKKNGWASAHEAMAVCADANSMDWIMGYFHGEKPQMKGDGWAWMLMGDMGEDNSEVGHIANWTHAAAHPDTFIQSGSHLMLMPKDPDNWKNYTANFSKGSPYVMFQNDPHIGDKYAHIMIPVPNYYAYQPESAPSLAVSNLPEPEGNHTSAAWKIWAYSSAAPAFLAGGARVGEFDAAGKMNLLKNPDAWNGFTCIPANPHPPADFATNGWATPHQAMPLCGDANVFAWVSSYFAKKAPTGMAADGFAWMLHGDMGEDNHKVGMVNNYTHAHNHPHSWIQSGPHLMLMPKDADAWKNSTMNFMSGSPYMMFNDDAAIGNMYAHVMIPMPGYYHFENDNGGLNPSVPSPHYWWMTEHLAQKFQIIQGGKILQEDGTPSMLLMTIVGAIMLALLLARVWVWRAKFQAKEPENTVFNHINSDDMELGNDVPCPE